MKAGVWFVLCCAMATCSAVVTVAAEVKATETRPAPCINALCECGVKPKRFVRHLGPCTEK